MTQNYKDINDLGRMLICQLQIQLLAQLVKFLSI